MNPSAAQREWRQSARLAAVQTPIIPVVAGLIRQNPGTISLGQGVVSYGPPAQCFERIEPFRADPENHKYKPVQGIPQLVEALHAKLSAENGIAADPRQIFVTAGGNLAFTNALLAIADPGDEVILQLPYYFNHEMAITMASCRPVLVGTDSRYQLQPSDIRGAITRRTRAIVTISPNNPTGAVYPEGALREVNRICREHGLYHIHDEAYEYFTYDGARHFSPGSLEGAGEYTISLFSFSKAYGFASWRIGYMAAPEHLVEAINKIQDTILICAPVISQYAALGALEAGKDYCLARLREIEQVRKIVAEALAKLGDICEVPPATGAFYFLLRVKTARHSLELAEELIRKHGVAVIPGAAFGLTTGCYLRVAYGALTPATASEGIGRLVHGLRELVS